MRMYKDRCVLPRRSYFTWDQNVFLGMVHSRLCATPGDSVADKLLANGNMKLDIVRHNLDGWGYYAPPDYLSAEISFATGKPALVGVSCPWDKPINHTAWRKTFEFLCEAHANGWVHYVQC